MGVPTYIDSANAIAHNKIMVIDQETVITGSLNFTKAAEEKNAENFYLVPKLPLGNPHACKALLCSRVAMAMVTRRLPG